MPCVSDQCMTNIKNQESVSHPQLIHCVESQLLDVKEAEEQTLEHFAADDFPLPKTSFTSVFHWSAVSSKLTDSSISQWGLTQQTTLCVFVRRPWRYFAYLVCVEMVTLHFNTLWMFSWVEAG